MEVLLFLSALLTALTGAISGVRAPEAVVHQRVGNAATCSVAAAAPVAAISARRSWLALAPAPEPLFAGIGVANQLFGTAAAPLYLGRLRQ